jgi:hypothetical protein
MGDDPELAALRAQRLSQMQVSICYTKPAACAYMIATYSMKGNPSQGGKEEEEKQQRSTLSILFVNLPIFGCPSEFYLADSITE